MTVPNAASKNNTAEAIARLTPAHLMDLRKSGLNDETIAKAGIHSEHDLGILNQILNRRYPKKCRAALVFPYRNSAGELNGYKRVKPDNPQKDANGKPRKYESPSGQPNRIYVPAGTIEHLIDAKTPIIVTEGEKKTLAADQAGFPCIGLVGVFGWKHGKGADRLLMELEALPWKGRDAFIAYDSDATQNDQVKDAERRLAALLKNQGAVVKIVRLPNGPAGEKVGLDDFLVASGKGELYRLLKEATDAEPVDAGTSKAPAKSIDSMPEAERLLLKYFAHVEGKNPVLSLRYFRDEPYCYAGSGYVKATEGDLRAKIKNSLHPSFFGLTLGSTMNVLDAVKAIAHISSDKSPPVWLGGNTPFSANEILSTTTGLIHLPSLVEGREYRHPPTPRFFTFAGVDYGFDVNAPKPELWLHTLDQYWPDDQQSIDTLQEWFGLMLTPDTSYHKILGLIGATRGGKGTILRIMQAMVGERNTASPTLAGLGTQFGLWPLLDKTLAVISDARLSGRTDAAIVTERLLSISGEDVQTVDRKCLQPVTTKLPARFVISTNEIPRLADSSGALAARMVVLKFTKSFYGQEDRQLSDKLRAELPGILWWAIKGWKRLRERGAFIQPESGKDSVNTFRDIMSPVGEFVRETCVVAAGSRVAKDELFAKWGTWCQSRRRDAGEESAFAKDLYAAFPNVVSSKKLRQKGNDHRIRVYEGIGLKAQPVVQGGPRTDPKTM